MCAHARAHTHTHTHTLTLLLKSYDFTFQASLLLMYFDILLTVIQLGPTSPKVNHLF